MSGEWIPVTERLPEKGIPVIGWFPGATQSFECSLNEHDGVWCDYGTGIHLYDDERPTHWMPFPAGPTPKMSSGEPMTNHTPGQREPSAPSRGSLVAY